MLLSRGCWAQCAQVGAAGERRDGPGPGRSGTVIGTDTLPTFLESTDDDKRVLTDRRFLQPGGGLSRFGHGSVYHGLLHKPNVDPKTSHGHHSDFDRRVKEAKNSSVSCTFTA